MPSLTLDAQQQAVVDDLLRGNHGGGAILAAPMGEGKTLPATATALRLGASVILLVVPIGTRVGWERTFRLYGYQGEFFRLETAQKENFEKLKSKTPGVYLIGWEYMVRQKFVNLAAIKPDVLIGDEVHRAQNRKSATHENWRRLKPSLLRMGLSGTWYGNKFEGAWAVARAAWPAMIDGSFWRWTEMYAGVELSCANCREIVIKGEKECPRCGHILTERSITREVLGEKNPGEFARSLPAYYWWQSEAGADDVWRMPALKHPLYVELSKKQRRMYDQMEDSLISWVEEGNPLVAGTGAERYMRLRQMALGVPSVEETGEIKEDGTPKVRVWFDEKAESTKITALNEFLADHPDNNVLVLVDSRVFADILPERLKANVRLWTGETPHKEREDILRTWGTDPNKREVLVATIQAIGEGVDGLQHVCHTVAWLNKSTNGIMNDQAAARIARRGQTKRVVSVEIIATETDDEPDNSRLGRALAARKASIEV